MPDVAICRGCSNESRGGVPLYYIATRWARETRRRNTPAPCGFQTRVLQWYYCSITFVIITVSQDGKTFSIIHFRTDSVGSRCIRVNAHTVIGQVFTIRICSNNCKCCVMRPLPQNRYFGRTYFKFMQNFFFDFSIS